MKKITDKTNARDIWVITGDFGEICGTATIENGKMSAETNGVVAETVTETDDLGVCTYTTSVTNTSDKNITLNCLQLKFQFDGGEYEVYSQYNGWQNESMGAWQPLVTSVSAICKSVRNTSSAAPFMVLWSSQTNRGTAFHLLAQSAWELTASRIYAGGELTAIEVYAGILKDNFTKTLAPGESFALPTVITYDVLNKVDLDCYKIHNYCHTHFPRREMPVLYNTWMYQFDKINYESAMAQIPRAKELGVEYFVVDAGWFGDGSLWWGTRGDWKENMTGGFYGRTAEFADEVHKAGMKFGFWLEPESAGESAEILKTHPDYFIEYKGNYFLDFANPEAREHIFNITCQLIDRFHADFMKFDFNSDLSYDKYQSAFTAYFEGYNEYLAKVKARYPDLYLCNCASGGQRMSVRDGKDFDSFWFTDDQSPYEGLRIVKDTIRRMPANWMERWAVIRSLDNFGPVYDSDELTEKILATNDATWNSIAAVFPDFISGFMLGGPISFSCDLNSFTDNLMKTFKQEIADFKVEREFWKTAVCRILCDTESVLVLQYTDITMTKSRILVYTHKIRQDNVTLFPMVDENASYKLSSGIVMTGKEINTHGIDVALPGNHRTVKCYFDKI